MENPFLKILRIIDLIYRSKDNHELKWEAANWFWENYIRDEHPSNIEQMFEKGILINPEFYKPHIFNLCPNCSNLLRFEPFEKSPMRSFRERNIPSSALINDLPEYMREICDRCSAVVVVITLINGDLKFEITNAKSEEDFVLSGTILEEK
jgi:hypothetical protein